MADLQAEGADAEATSIFLSYSRKERETAARLADALRERGFTVFRDTDDILPTEEWRGRLESLIAEADTVVFLLSSNSVMSEVCSWEVEYATSLQKRIAPIVIEDVDSKSIPPLLARLNFIFCTERDRFLDAVDTLVSALNTDIDWIREHTRLAGLANRWEQAGRSRRLLLRRHDIADAEAWRDRRPAGAPEVTAAQAAFIAESRRIAGARQRNWVLGSLAAALFALSLSALSYSLYVRADKELNTALLEQSRFLYESAKKYFDSKNYMDAMALALKGLPKDKSLRDRPVFAPLADVLVSSALLNREVLSVGDGKSAMTHVAFSPDGSLLFTTSLDGTASLWSTKDGQEKVRFKGHTDAILSAAVDFKADIAITGSADKTARLWRLSTGRQIGSPIEHGDAVWSVALSPDGKVAASAAREDHAFLSSTADGTLLATLNGHTGAVSDLAFNADGAKLVTGSADHTARVWSVPSGEPLRVLEGHTDAITSVDFSPAGDIVITGSHDETARLWNVDADQPAMATLRGHTDSVVKVAFSPSGRLAFTGSDDKTARLWNVETGKEIATLAGHGGRITRVAFSPGTPALATGSDDRTVRIWRAETAPALVVLNGHDDVIWDLAYSSDSRLIATASADGTARIWKAAPSVADRRFDPPPGGYAYRMALSPDGSRLAVTQLRGWVKVLDSKTLSEIKAWKAHETRTLAIAFSPDGKSLLTGAEGGEVKLWDAESGELKRSLVGHTDDVTRVAFSPDGAFAATASQDNTARLWSLAGGGDPVVLQDDETPTALAFTHDGKSILVAGSSGTVRKLSVPDGTKVGEYGPFSFLGPTLGMNLSPDGKTLLVSAFGAEPKLVRLKDGKEIGVLRGHQNYVETLRYGPEGRRAITLPTDGVPLLWRMDDETILARYEGVPGARDALFSKDGQAAFFIGEDGVVTRWRAPRSLADEIQREAGVVRAADPLSLKQRCENFLASADDCTNMHLLKGQ